MSISSKHTVEKLELCLVVTNRLDYKASVRNRHVEITQVNIAADALLNAEVVLFERSTHHLASSDHHVDELSEFVEFSLLAMTLLELARSCNQIHW